MPQQRFDSIAELSLRHLPDLSSDIDASFSFQIPTGDNESLLLATGDDTFFNDRGSFATPVSTRISREPLTLNDLTPKTTLATPSGGTATANSFPSHSQPYKPSSSPRRTTSDLLSDSGSLTTFTRPAAVEQEEAKLPETSDQSSMPIAKPLRRGPHATIGTRFESLKVEVETLGDDTPNDSPNIKARGLFTQAPALSNSVLESRDLKTTQAERFHTKPMTARPKRTVASGGVVKNQSTKKSILPPAATRTAKTVAPIEPQRPSVVEEARPVFNEPVDDTRTDPDESLCSPAGGVAGRLVMYGQKLMSSYSLHNTERTSSGQQGEIFLSITSQATNKGREANMGEYADPNIQKLPKILGNSPRITEPIEPDAQAEAPLTLSQISPRKASLAPLSIPPNASAPPAKSGDLEDKEATLQPAIAPKSPMRRSSKRPADNAITSAIEQQARKKGKQTALTTSQSATAGSHHAATNGGVHQRREIGSNLRRRRSPVVRDDANVRESMNGGTRKRLGDSGGSEVHSRVRQGRGNAGVGGSERFGKGRSGSQTRSGSSLPPPPPLVRTRSRRNGASASESDAQSKHRLLQGKNETVQRGGSDERSTGPSRPGRNTRGVGGVVDNSRPRRVITPAIATEHVEFNFTTGTRVEPQPQRQRHAVSASSSTNNDAGTVVSGECAPNVARSLSASGTSSFSASRSSSSSTMPLRARAPRDYLASIPDFKAMHAAHEAKVAQRKENIHPVVPFALDLRTDERARERAKFDERMREKEMEMEREKEERRKEEEAIEEREIRELRKRTVPRANEVPEWYKDVPRRKEEERSGVSSFGS